MVDRVKLLEDLEGKVSVRGQEIFFLVEENYNKESVWLDRALGLMRRVYEDIKDKFPNEPIVQHIKRFCDDMWDVLLPPEYEHRHDYAE